MAKRLFSPTNLLLAILYAIFCSFVIYLSIHDENGYVTSDSAHYLQLAQNILDGHGLSTANYVDGMSTYFATWPVGYPVLIALVSLITGAGVFWASKICNMLCLLICFIILKRLFGERAVFASLIFSISTLATMFVYTWSEVPFLLGMLWLAFGLVRYMETNKKRYAVHMALAALLMFLMRYIGLIGGGIIGLIGFVYLFRKQWKQMWACWISGGSVIIIAGLYLLNNQLRNGLATGMERIPRAETVSEFAAMLKDSILTEINIFSNDLNSSLIGLIVIAIIAIAIFVRPKQLKALFQLKLEQFRLPAIFLLIGCIYLIAIIYMRWTAYFDTFNFRLLGPATFTFSLFIVSWVTELERPHWSRWRSTIGFVLIIALLSNVGYEVLSLGKSNNPTYSDTVQQVEKTYEQIPPKSIVAFENFHARYLRTDIQFIKVHFQPYFADAESVDQFKKRIIPNDAAGVYLQKKSLVGYTYGSGFAELMKQAGKEKKDFIKIP